MFTSNFQFPKIDFCLDDLVEFKIIHEFQLREQLLHLRSAKSTRLFFQEYENFNSKSLSALEEHLNKLAKLG